MPDAYIDLDKTCLDGKFEQGGFNSRSNRLWNYIQTAQDMASDVNRRMKDATRRNPIDKTRVTFRQRDPPQKDEVAGWAYQAIMGDVGYAEQPLMQDGNPFKTLNGIDNFNNWVDFEWKGALNRNSQPAQGVMVWPGNTDKYTAPITPCEEDPTMEMYTVMGQGNLENEAHVMVCELFWDENRNNFDTRSINEINSRGLREGNGYNDIDNIKTPEGRIFREFARIVAGIRKDVQIYSAVKGTPIMQDRCMDFLSCYHRRNDQTFKNVDVPYANELLATMLFLNPAVIVHNGRSDNAPYYPDPGAVWCTGAVDPATLWALGG
ncbi:MAG: hypothetical protein Q9227_001332 [Pyrenula ochraceoflavens]